MKFLLELLNEYDNYDDAAEATVSKKQALAQIKTHTSGFDEYQEFVRDFFSDVGEKDFYKGSEVLDWLGY